MADALVVGVGVKWTHRHHHLFVIVVDSKQIAELSFLRFLVGNHIGSLYIKCTIAFFRHEIYLRTVQLSNAHGPSVANEVHIDHVLNTFLDVARIGALFIFLKYSLDFCFF